MFKLILKIVGSIVAVVVVLVSGLIAKFYFIPDRPVQPVGFEQIVVTDPQDKPLTVDVWYPTDSPLSTNIIGLSAQLIALHGNVTGRDLPLVLMSHGSGGVSSEHADTSLALASAGFVVAAITHTGDNAQDQSLVGTSLWLTERARHIHVLTDYMLNSWRAHNQLNPMRIGLFGYSAGAFTAIVSIGGVPDLAQIGQHCRTHPEFLCTFWKKMPSSVAAVLWVHEPRIRSAVLAAPGFGFAFDSAGLARVKVPVQLWNGTKDQFVPYETNGAAYRRLLPSSPEFHMVNGADHFAYLAPCPTGLLLAFCADPSGFDRREFHREFNKSVVAFFQKHLLG